MSRADARISEHAIQSLGEVRADCGANERRQLIRVTVRGVAKHREQRRKGCQATLILVLLGACGRNQHVATHGKAALLVAISGVPDKLAEKRNRRAAFVCLR